MLAPARSVSLASLVLCLLIVGKAWAQLPDPDESEEQVAPVPLGPGAHDAPLPPQRPYAPGERKTIEPADHDNSAPVAERTDSVSRDHGRIPPQAAIAADTKRPLPDYDGRPEPTSFGDILVWVPRVLLSPLYLTSEYVIRRPLGWLVTTAERKKWPALLVDFFTFGPERQAGVIPTGLIDFGFRPSVGFYFFWNDFVVEDNFLRVRAATGGRDWWLVTAIERYELAGGHALYLSGELSTRPDWVYHGLGPDSPNQAARFGKRLAELQLGHHADSWRSTEFDAFVAVRDVKYSPDGACCNDPSLESAIAAGRVAEPPGLVSGFRVIRHGFSMSLDSRPERVPDRPRPGEDFVSPPGAGLKLELRGEHAASPWRRPTPHAQVASYDQWVKYGATVGGFVDLDSQRVLGLQVLADFADPAFAGNQIPFTELISLGGDRPLRGFLEGRLLDRSAIAARFSYTWPVWVWLDGMLHYSVGNVFGEHLAGFDAQRLRSSFGLGLGSTDSRDHSFEILIAAGTKPFEMGAGVENVRFVFGATSGF